MSNPVATQGSRETIAVFEKHVIPNYGRFPISLVHGEGSYVWDAEGNRYLDLFPGWGCNILGHCPPPVVRAIQEQVAHLIHIPNTWYTEQQGKFAEALAMRGFGQAFFCNSGAEAVEAAIKLARLHTAGERYRIITFQDGFHGRTLAATTATAQPKYHEGLGPLMSGFRYARFNDLDSVRELIDDETCALMVEPVQGEGGVNIASDDFMAGLRQLADEHGLLLIFDEVQTCMGRTGTWFGYQQWNIQPDIITLAKGLAGGVACGAILAKKEIAPSLRPGMHASTFGGNPLAMAAGLATVEMIEDQNLLANVQEMSERFLSRFEELKAELPIIRELRIRGLMVGVDLTIPSGPAVGKCMQRGVLVNATHETVVRLLPALNVTAEQVDEGCDVIAEVLREMAAEAESALGKVDRRMRHLNTLFHTTAGEVEEILNITGDLKAKMALGERPAMLAGKVAALLFEKPSLRTRISFEVAMTHLGGSSVFLTTVGAGLDGRESDADVARVLGGYADCIVMRTFEQSLIERFIAAAGCPIINGLSNESHPCQALTDFFTIREALGTLEGKRLAYVGDGNNVASSLAVCAALLNVPYVVSSPAGYELKPDFLQQLKQTVPAAQITLIEDPHTAVSGADVVYTDVWASMGQEAESDARKKIFAPYRVDAKLMASAAPHAKFMHCLPAKRGWEVTDEVLDGPHSIAFQQAENRMHVAKGILVWLLNEDAS